nr:hypothetical protein Iba_chr12dCG5510 [Ipomoea batatas]
MLASKGRLFWARNWTRGFISPWASPLNTALFGGKVLSKTAEYVAVEGLILSSNPTADSASCTFFKAGRTKLTVGNIEDDIDVASSESIQDAGVGIVNSQCSDAITRVQLYGIYGGSVGMEGEEVANIYGGGGQGDDEVRGNSVVGRREQ